MPNEIKCTICAYPLKDAFAACPACDAAEAIIHAGCAHPNYHELLAEQIGNVLMQRDWNRIISLENMFPRYV